MPKRSSRLHKDLRAIGKAFKALAHHFERIAPFMGEHADVVVTDLNRGKSTRRKPRLTAAHRARLKLQGRYMGTLRGLKPGQRAKVKKIRAAKGFAAAIKAAERMGSRQ